MNELFQSAFLKALGWALFDSLWQMGVLWLVYVLLTRNGKSIKAGQKHSLALLSLAGGAIWFIVTLVIHFYDAGDTRTVFTENRPTAISSINQFYTFLEPLLPFLSIIYLLSVVYLSIRLYRQYYFTQKLVSSGLYKVRPELRMFLKDVAARMGIRKDVRIWLSELVDTPLTIGFWKPVILLPVAIINQLSMQQAEAIILHELHHIRRNDYLINLLVACMDILLFFNPFVRILTNTIKNERENSCDDMVLQFRYDAEQYANALLILERNRMKTRSLAVNATGRSKKLLLNRVERILNKKSQGTAISQKLFATVVSGVLMAIIAFYNPGKVIVSTIQSVQPVSMVSDAEQQNFSTLNVVKHESIEKPLIEKRTSTNAIKLKNTEKAGREPQSTGTDLVDLLNGEMLNASTAIEQADYLIAYAGSDNAREFSISESTPPQRPDIMVEVHPYVPSASFTYHFIEDTLFPKKYILTQSDLKAKEAQTAALKALHEIDWQKIEKEVNASGKKVDIIKLQEELKKAIADVDWKKINDELQSSQMQIENELLKEHSKLQGDLQKFQHERSQKLVEQKKIYQAILDEKFCDDKHKEEKPVKKKTDQKKKIVYI